MAVAAQTLSRSNFREFAFTRDVVMRNNIDHVFSHSPTTAIFLGKALGDFGGVRLSGLGKTTQVGGHSVLLRVRLGKHAGSKRMAGPWDTHSTTPDDNTRFAEANWMHYSGALVVSKYDEGINRGDAAIASFIEDQTTSVMLSLVDTLGDDFYATTAPPNAITSLDTLISAASENASAQGLSGATFEHYNARGLSVRGTAPGSVSFTSGSFTAQGLADMRRLLNNASEGMVRPNVVMTTYEVHEFYEQTLQPLERFQGAVNVADGSFRSLAFRELPVLADPKVSSGAMFMLRVGDDGVLIKVLDGFDFVFDDFKPGANQETMVSELMWKGQLCIKNRKYGNNKMTGITA